MRSSVARSDLASSRVVKSIKCGEDEVDEETLNAALSESVQKEDLRDGDYEALEVDEEVFIYASGNVSDKQVSPSSRIKPL